MKPTIQISHSRIREWLTCRWRYDLSYNQQISSKVTRPSMRAGAVFHRLLEAFYSEGNLEPAVLQMNAEGQEVDPDAWKCALVYVEQERQDRNAFKPLLVEFPFEVPLNQLTMLKAGVSNDRVSFIGVMDLVAYYRGSLTIIDHKLQTNMPSVKATDHLAIAYPQLPLYSWASNFLGEPIYNALLNITGIRRANDKIQRYPIRFTGDQLAGWEKWLYSTIIDMLTETKFGRSLGSIACSDCPFAIPCELSLDGEGKRFAQVIERDFQPKESADKRRPIEWQRRFPPLPKEAK